MKTKKWITIGLISLAVLIASVVLLFVLVLPGINRVNGMKALEEGNKTEASKYFGEMEREKQEDFKDDVKDLVVYKANQCLKGEISYDEFFKVMDTIEDVRGFRGMTEAAFVAVNGPRMKNLYQEAVEEYKKNGSSSAFTAKRDEFRLLRDAEWNGYSALLYNWDDYDDFRDKLQDPLEADLKAQYSSYQAGTVDYDTMAAYIEVAENFWYSENAYTMSSEMYYDKVLKQELEEAKEYYDKEDYWSALRIIDNAKEWYGEEAAYSKWASRFDTMKEEAETKAKTYYVDKAIEAAKEGDTYEVESIISQLKDRFGEDFDVSAIEQNLHTEWQKAYVEYFAGDWKSDIQTEIDYIDPEDDFYGLKHMDMDKDLPTKMFMYDFDNDKVPEILLANSTYMFIYAYYNGSVRLAGGLQWRGLGDKPYIVSTAVVQAEVADINVTLLVKYEKGELAPEKMTAYATSDGQEVYAVATTGDNLEQVEKDAYNTATEEILAQVKTTSLSGGANVSDYEKYIYSWKED